MIKTYKTEIRFNEKQKIKFHKSVGICRWLYNQYVSKNKEQYQLFLDGKVNKSQSFISANEFDKYINNNVKVTEEFQWINDCGSKARKKSLVNAEAAFKQFFKGQSGYPRFKKKNNQDITLYFPKNNKGDWLTQRHRIKVPTFGWVQVKEFGYIPLNAKVINGIISQKAGRYYVSVTTEVESIIRYNQVPTENIGIDLGLKEFAIISDGQVYENINKSERIIKLEKKLLREKRSLSRKYESMVKAKNMAEGRVTRQNIQKQVLKVQRIHRRLTDIRTDYINKTVSSIIERNPSSITIEDLNVRGMMMNRHLSKAVSKQKFYEFRVKLTIKCKINNIELRIVDRWYPSSKLCSCCGFKKEALKLSDRIFVCDNCNTSIDRDLNASINLKNAKEYRVA